MGADLQASRRHWQRVSEMLSGALALPPGERPIWLESACGGDSALRAELEELLAVDPGLLAELERPAVDLLSSPPSPWPDVPGYLLLQEVGRGGVGEVYLGSPASEPGHTVAIKVLKRGMDSDEVLGRFRIERQILANLSHPNIVLLLDAGATADGRPFLVMEHIRGQPIDSYVSNHGLDRRRRTEIFLEVCAAVQFAHQNLVVHRDLKPGNVLVDAAGEPKLIDFGIAKLLQAEAPGPSTLTRLGGQPMTSLYASPEQLLGEPITTATDVYSLGVILYELLAGASPYQGELRCEADLRRAIVEVGPAAPSRFVRELAGDFDAILLKALARQPRDRYPSAEHLAEDLRRHLGGRPVEARPPTLPYRAGRFLKRHRRECLVATLMVLALAGAAIEHAVALRRTERELAQAMRLARFLGQVLAPHDLTAGPRGSLSVRQVLDAGVEKVDRELASEPALQATALTSIGAAYNRLGLYPQADLALDRALELRRKSLGPGHPLVADSLEALAGVAVSRGRYARAEELTRAALELRREALGSGAPRLLNSRVALAALEMDGGRFHGAERGFRQALLAIRAQEEGPTPGEAAVRGNLALSLYYQDRLPEAEEEARAALDVSLRLLGPVHPQVSSHESGLARVLAARGELTAAAELADRARTTVESQVGRRHPAVARLLALRARIAAAAGDLHAAEELAGEAVAIWRGQADGDLHPDAAAALLALAEARRLRGQPSAALAPAEEAVELRARLLGPDHPDLAGALLELARVDREREAPARLPANVEQAREILLRAGLSGHRWLAELAALGGEAAQRAAGGE